MNSFIQLLAGTSKKLLCACARFFSSTSAQSSTTRLQAALRPFIFSVHPDLFSQHPEQKRVNENSLKILNEYMQCGEQERKILSNNPLKFYQKVHKTSGFPKLRDGNLKLLKVKLDNDMLGLVRRLLSESDLPLDEIDEIIESHNSEMGSSSSGQPDRPIQWIHRHYFAATGKEYPFTDIWEELDKMKPAVTLHRWVSTNIQNTRHLASASKQLRIDYKSLHNEVKEKYGLADVVWSCGWRGTHQLACLRRLDQLLKSEQQYQQLVKGRVILFASEGGVSFNGDIVLCSDEVPQQWAKALNAIRTIEPFLKLIPDAERHLSSLLGGIQIVHRTMPPLPMAQAYYSSLASLISRLGMAYNMSSFATSQSLSHLQLAVTGSIGDEMTLTPEGHISVPSHSPVWAIKNFIRDNEESAVNLQEKYFINKAEVERLMQLVTEDYGLESLSIDSSISYDKAIVCCENLLASSDSVRYMLSGVRVCIAPYFAVMSDGEMYIMWDWVSDG